MTLQNREQTYMGKLRVAVWMAIMALGVICSATAQDTVKHEPDAEIQKAILAVDNERYEAMQKKDMAALDRLHADGLVFINTKGRMLSKAEYMEEIRSG